MTSDTKWITVTIGFAVSFYLGWVFPVLWFIWLVGTVVVLLVPTKKKVPAVVPAQPLVSVAPNNDSLGDIEAALRAKAASANNDDVREGLNQALAIIAQHHQLPAQQPVVVPVQVVATAPVEPPAKPLDQTLVLLYIGAFLLLGGMSLFVAYGDVSNQLRITIIAIMAAVFYGGGLYLYRTKETLRPAGVTFVSIGLLMMPLVGFATAYLIDTSSPELVWLLTSLVALPLYLIALYVTRAQVVGYMAFLMWLSLAESAVNLFDAPVHIFVWVAIAIGIVTQLLISRYAKNTAELREPFRWSTLVLVPAAVVASILYLDNGVAEWQLGVSLLLSGLYYAVCVYTSKGTDSQKDGYLIAAHSTSALGVLFLAHDAFDNELAFGYSVMAIGLLHLALWFVWRQKLTRFKVYEHVLYGLAGLLTLVACIWFVQDSTWLLVGLLAALATNVCLMLGGLRSLSVVLSVIVGLLLPLSLANITPGFSNEHIVAALSTYYVAAFICFLVARILRNVYPLFFGAMQVGYGITLGLAYILALSSSEYWIQVVVSLVVLAALVGLSTYEKKVWLYYLLSPVAAILFGIFFHHVSAETEVADVIIYSIVVASAASYAASLIIEKARGEVLLIMGIGGGVMAWLVSTMVAADHVVLVRYLPPTILAITSLTALGEQKRLKGGSLFVLLPSAGLLLALCQAIYLADNSTNLLVYTHLWSLYGLAATYLVSTRTANKEYVDLLTYATLAVFTLPVVVRAFDETGSYSLLLLFEQSALLLAGVALRKKVLTYWGAAVVILSVIYLLRSLAYLQLLLIAVILIGYALYRLTRAK